MRISDWSSDVCSSDLWSIFTSDAYLSDISIEFLDQQTTEPTGTTIEIFELNESWSQEKVNQLFLELRKLVSPLHWSGSAPDFRIFLDLSECTRETAEFDGAALVGWSGEIARSEEHTSELQSLMRISYAVFCLKN